MGFSLDITELPASQYPEDVKPYIRLWSSVLYKGLQDAAVYMAKAGGKRAPRVRLTCMSGDQHQAFDWLWSDNQRPTSFIWICETLGMDAGTVRNYFYKNWRNLVRTQIEEEKKNED